MSKELVAVLACLFVFSGCAVVTGYQDSIDEYNQNFISKNCDISELDKKIKKDDDAILSANQAGALLRNCGDFNASVAYFDEAESRYKFDVDESGVVSKSASEVGSALVNENALDYEGFYYERVMTNIYKALNFMSQSKIDDARIELNRAIDRQRLAKEMYAKELQNAKDELEKSKKDGKNQEQQDSANSQFLSQYQSSIGEFEALPEFVNPFTYYLSGIFFLATNDYEKSRDLFKEVALMSSTNKQILDDAALADNLSKQTANKNRDKYVWIIYENGQTVSRKEFRLDLPLFIFAQDKVPMLNVAVTTLDKSVSSYAYLNVNDGQTSVIADMDAVVKSEFKSGMPLRVTRIIARTIVKAALSYGANEAAGGLGSIAAGIYTTATNKADVRYWSTLPQNFQSIRVVNKAQELKIKDDAGDVLANIKLKADKDVIIYIKSLAKGAFKIDEIYF